MTATLTALAGAPSIAPAGAAPTSGAQRYADDIVRLHDRLRFGGLPGSISGEPLYAHDYGDGLITIAARESQIPHRYLLGLYGFRLAQYLRLGWMSPEIVYQRALFHEPERPPHVVPDIHIVTLCPADGRIRGYVCLAASLDPRPLPFDDETRTRLAVEQEHDLDLLGRYAAPDWTTHDVFEGKRLVRDQTMQAGYLATRIPWHILLAMARSLLVLRSASGQVLLVGDAKERGVLHHLRLFGYDLDVIEGTSPSLPRSNLMWPIYASRQVAKPFVGRLPAALVNRLDVIESFLRRPPGSESIPTLLSRLAARQTREAS